MCFGYINLIKKDYLKFLEKKKPEIDEEKKNSLNELLEKMEDLLKRIEQKYDEIKKYITKTYGTE